MALLDELLDIGQHLWLDDISATSLEDGTIARYRDECGVTGITANPTIFDRAIRSGAYDDRITELDGSPSDVFWNLAIEDVRQAADLMAHAFRRSDGRTGWVSLELSPELADDATGSIEQGRELHRRVDRPNVMVKVPGTTSGAVAIEELTFVGVPVNVTLLFGREQWRAASAAYARGLERRRDAGLSLAVPSVASLFLSRIDGRLDPDLPPELAHQAALAVAAAVYGEWQQLIGGQGWRRLVDEGASTQQLLWASTSPKSDDLDETHYASGLAVPETVITLPTDTLDEVCSSDHPAQRLDDRSPAEVEAMFERIEAAAGVTLDQVADELQAAGVESFQESFASLLDAIANVRDRVVPR
jgi:transaldolase